MIMFPFPLRVGVFAKHGITSVSYLLYRTLCMHSHLSQNHHKFVLLVFLYQHLCRIDLFLISLAIARSEPFNKFIQNIVKRTCIVQYRIYRLLSFV